MDASSEQETTPLIPRYGIPAPIRDKRKPYQKQLAVYFILASTLFERIAFYSLENNVDLLFSQNITTSTSWNPRKSSTGLLLMFFGNSYT